MTEKGKVKRTESECGSGTGASRGMQVRESEWERVAEEGVGGEGERAWKGIIWRRANRRSRSSCDPYPLGTKLVTKALDGTAKSGFDIGGVLRCKGLDRWC